MAIPFNDNLHVAAPKPVDKRYLNNSNLPYSNTSEVLSTIPVYERYVGLTVLLTGGIEYWFQPDVNTIVEKTGGSTTGSTGTVTGATNGLSLLGGGKQIGLGGLITGATQIDMPFGASLTISGLTGSLVQINSGFNIIGNFDQAVVYVQQGDIYGFANGGVTLQNNAGGLAFGENLRVTDSRPNGSHTGLEYQFDYSADFTDRSLVDKGWVLSQLSTGSTGGGITGGTNGIIADGQNLKLGGTLTEYTQILIDPSIGFNAGINDSDVFVATVVERNQVTSQFSNTDGVLSTGYLKRDGNDYATLEYYDFGLGQKTYLRLTPNREFLIGSEATGFSGLTYDADYGANFTDQSLVTKSWVLSQISTGSTGAGTLNDVLSAGSDANGQTITELLGVANSTNDFNVGAPNIYMDGPNSAVLQSSAGGAYLAGAIETIIGDGVGSIAISLPVPASTGSLFYHNSSNYISALPVGSGKQVIGIKSGLPAYKQLKYDDINMPSGSLLGRTSATSGATELIAAQDGVDISGGNLRLGGAVGNNINFTATSQKLFQFDDNFDISIQGTGSTVRMGFGGNYVSSVRMLSMGFSTGVGRGTIGNISTLALFSGFTLTMASGEASNLNGSPITLTSGPAHNSGNGKGGDIKLTAGIGHGSGADGNIVLDLGPNGFLQFLNGGVAAAVSTTITHKLPIKIGSTTYYLSLTATA